MLIEENTMNYKKQMYLKYIAAKTENKAIFLIFFKVDVLDVWGFNITQWHSKHRWFYYMLFHTRDVSDMLFFVI